MRGRKRQRKKNDKRLMRGLSFGYTEFTNIFDRVTKGQILAQWTLTIDPAQWTDDKYVHNFPDESA